MLKRNLAVKEAPERWQDSAADGSFDIVVCFEQKVFELVIEGKLRVNIMVCDGGRSCYGQL